VRGNEEHKGLVVDYIGIKKAMNLALAEYNKGERDFTHFYLAVRSIVFKLTKGNAPDTAQMNAKVR
jgi:type I site-specific restriction-modification system R (restriction) subunit